MEAIGLNPIRLDAIGIDPIRLNAIKLGVPGASSGSDRPYIDPEVLASLVAVCICDGKSNNDPDRAIIKNLVDPDNPFVISNAAYKLNSGYGKYEEDFTTLNNRSNTYIELTPSSILVQGKISDLWLAYTTINPFNLIKIRIKNLPIGGRFEYRYYNGIVFSTIVMEEDGEYKLPASQQHNNGIGFRINDNNLNWKGFIVEQIPSFQGALVTDGVDDLIVSQKTVQEMLGGSNKITVVSMIHQIGRVATNTNLFTNCIQYNTGSKGHNIVNYQTSLGKTGIYGYSRANVSVANNEVVINNILGDKADYLTNVSIGALTSNEKFSVVGYLDVSPQQVTSVAVYWTFISNKVLTTDEINQIIGYFKLDKYVTPQVIYAVKRQGLTNDTPAADWYLKDFSGNGHDMTLYNFAKKLGSGIGKYEVDFNTWIPQSYVADSAYTSNKLHITNIKGGNAILYTIKGANAMKVKITGIQSFNLVYRYIAENDVWEALEVDRDGIYELPASTTTTKTYYTGFTVPYYTGDCDITIEQIPDYEGALVSDGKDDYGKAEGLPILKDYTVAADYARLSYGNIDSAIISKSYAAGNGAFGFNLASGQSPNNVSAISFGTGSAKIQADDNYRKIRYQSKYVNDGVTINAGNGIDGNEMWLSCLRENYNFSESALYSMLLFQYTLSEFLLERQLKKYKLGTLYPDMVEFRPVISGNIPYNAIEISQGPTTLYNKSINKTGIYLQEGSTVRVYIQPSGIDEVSKITINGVEYTDLPINPNGYYYADFPITKSPQKISYAIDEYIRYEDIVQPYPAIINLKQDGKTITWGDKLKVGSDIVFVGSANLLPELYTVSDTRYNGVTLYPNTIIKVEKSMVFDNARTYLKANEPSCILSPNRLRIPNSSYKILGYIPDLTGKGNHGKLNNFAYAGMSGANGYVEDFTTWSKPNGISVTDNKIIVTDDSSPIWILYKPKDAVISSFKTYISGIPSGGILRFAGSAVQIQLQNGENIIPNIPNTTAATGFIIAGGTDLDWSNLVIEQIGEYEGSFCLDGVDDFITIPTLSHGAKQVLMKVNTQNMNGILYDQRKVIAAPYHFAIYNYAPYIAYKDRNTGGNTYIDGVLNNNITCQKLLNITHNLTITNNGANESNTQSPVIGASRSAAANFSKFALFAFMSFDDISSEEEIKELNDIVGIEGGYVESPDYYWDAYGKSNTQADDIDDGIRNINNSKMSIFDKSITGLTAIEQTNADASVGRVYDRALNLKNFAFNEESGYGGNKGYSPEFPKSDGTVINSGWRTSSAGKAIFERINNNKVIITKAIVNTLFWTNYKTSFSYYKISGLSSRQSIIFGNDTQLIQLVTADKDGIYEVDWSKNIDESGAIKGLCIMTNFIGDCNITIEQVTKYQNGLVSDGVDDHLINTNIPAFTDFTVIAKRKFLNTELKLNETFCMKGDKSYSGGVGNAFVMEYFYGNDPTSKQTYMLSFGGTNALPREESDVSWCTPTNYNGIEANRGEGGDTVGLMIGKYGNTYWNGVFYKMMLYSKTIDKLSINMLKNLFERDELIDVNNPIFKQNN